MKFIVSLFFCLGLILTLHPRNDAFAISQVSDNSTVKLWDVASGKTHDISLGKEDVTALAFSPNGRLLAIGSGNRDISLWDLDGNKKVASLSGHKGAVQSLAFSPDGKVLASGSWDRTIKLWNIATDNEIATLVDNSEGVLSITLSPDGNFLASGGGDEKIRLWNMATKKVIRVFKGHALKVNSVAFSFDGKLLATASDDKTVKIWDIGTGKLLFTLEGHTDVVESVAFSPDGKTLASGSNDQSIKLWDTLSGSELSSLKGHLSAINYVAFSPNGRILASGSYDKTVKLWDIQSRSELRTLEGHTQRVTSVAFSPDGKTLASGSALYRAESPTLHVLSIGISNYSKQDWPSIEFAAKDATDIASAFEKAGGAKFERVKVRRLIDFAASQAAISSAFYKIISEAKPQDVFVLFFAGHASSDLDPDTQDEQFYLHSTDGQNVSDILLRSWLTKIEARHQFIILEMNDSRRGYEKLIQRFATEKSALKALLRRDLVVLANAFQGTPMANLRNRFLTHALLEGIAGGAALESGELTVRSLVNFAKAKQSAIPKAFMQRAGEISSFVVGEDFHLGYVPAGHHSGANGSSQSAYVLPASRTNNHMGFQSFAVPSTQLWQKIGTASSAALLGQDVSISRKGKDYALLIATDTYQRWKPLSNPIRDAKAIAKELKDYYGFETEIVESPTMQEVVNALEKYYQRQYGEDDQLFIFFAGHGTYKQMTKAGYLITKDSLSNDEDKIGSSYLSYDMLRNVLDSIPCKHIFLVIDACYSGTFDQTIAKSGSTRGSDDVPPPQFIERKMQFKTRRFLTSAGKETTPDGDEGRHSPFTSKLLEGLRSYGGRDGYLTINKLLLYVERIDPTPISSKWGDNEEGSDFFFVVKKR